MEYRFLGDSGLKVSLAGLGLAVWLVRTVAALGSVVPDYVSVNVLDDSEIREGIKVYGSGRFQVPDSNETIEGAYAIIVFGGNGFMQQLVLSWKDNDPYSEAIVERILQSLDVKTAV